LPSQAASAQPLRDTLPLAGISTCVIKPLGENLLRVPHPLLGNI
jgi:hypothetical protein